MQVVITEWVIIMVFIEEDKERIRMKIQQKTIAREESYLRQKSKPVDFKDPNIKQEIKKLETFCLETECFALAAVQIGIPKRMIYLKNTTLDVPLEKKEYNESKVLINPIILERKGHTRYWEACLSCLDYMGLVNRPYSVVLQYQDQDGRSHLHTFQGFEATVLSHELDHLDGILHMDIAEEVQELEKEQRKEFRKEHPYEIISKTCDYNEFEMSKKKR